jgi:DNA-binding response OmpR family regulator
MAWKVAVIEDDAKLARAVATGLRHEGCQVKLASSAADGLKLIQEWNPDLILVDLMLPDNEGPSLFLRLRAKTKAALVGMSARSMLSDVVASLKLGADDYITKPFAFEELNARVGAMLRRVRSDGVRTVDVGDLEIDFGGGVALRAGEPLDLTATEFRILAVLARSAGKFITQRNLADEVWPAQRIPNSNSLGVHIARLRKKLDQAGTAVTVRAARGMGYSLRER